MSMKIKHHPLVVIVALATFSVVFPLSVWLFSNPSLLNAQFVITLFVLTASLVLSLQGLFTLIWMLYAWENPEDMKKHKSPKKFVAPQLSFTALLPARHEEKVIGDTIKAIDKINYPEKLKEILVLCREDDTETIIKAEEVIKQLGKKNIRLIVFNSFPINKPHALNYGLQEAKNRVISIFDAEDEPHKEIYNIVNTTMLKDKVDVIQSGVQLMNYRTRWFSALNVVEYYLWFKSGLHFFSNIGRVTPLGGNTVFFKKYWLDFIGGWDKDCLTEDADIGIRLTLAGAKTKVFYDEAHTTQEETPNSAVSFIKQRTRWNQGFLQILLKGDWGKLPMLRQKMVAAYVLLSPMMQALLLLYMPLGVTLALTQKLPIWVTLLSFIPLYLFVLQLLTFTVALYKFTKEYRLRFSLLSPLRILLAFYPYQLMLVFSSFRAFYRILASKNAWEKTLHTNAHREMADLSLATQYAK